MHIDLNLTGLQKQFYLFLVVLYVNFQIVHLCCQIHKVWIFFICMCFLKM